MTDANIYNFHSLLNCFRRRPPPRWPAAGCFNEQSLRQFAITIFHNPVVQYCGNIALVCNYRSFALCFRGERPFLCWAWATRQNERSFSFPRIPPFGIADILQSTNNLSRKVAHVSGPASRQDTQKLFPCTIEKRSDYWIHMIMCGPIKFTHCLP